MPAGKNKQPVYARFFGETKQIVNGQVVQDSAVNTEYNGEKLHIDKMDNGHIAHYDIKDKQLKKLLLRPKSNVNLFERLSQDYGRKRTKRKRSSTTKHKRSSTTKHKRSSTTKRKRRSSTTKRKRRSSTTY
jgi:PAB1-binding protein PBP1